MRCTACGSEAAPGARFCAACGARLAAEPPAAGPLAPLPPLRCRRPPRPAGPVTPSANLTAPYASHQVQASPGHGVHLNVNVNVPAHHRYDHDHEPERGLARRPGRVLPELRPADAADALLRPGAERGQGGGAVPVLGVRAAAAVPDPQGPGGVRQLQGAAAGRGAHPADRHLQPRAPQPGGPPAGAGPPAGSGAGREGSGQPGDRPPGTAQPAPAGQGLDLRGHGGAAGRRRGLAAVERRAGAAVLRPQRPERGRGGHQRPPQPPGRRGGRRPRSSASGCWRSWAWPASTAAA